MARAVVGNAPAHLGLIGRIEFEAYPGVAHERRVDFGTARRVGGRGRADARRQTSTAVPLTLTISIEPVLPITS